MLIRNWAEAARVCNDNIAANRMCFLIIFFLLRTVFLNDEVVNDEVLTLHRVLSHIILQEFLHLVVLMEGDLLQTDVRTYKTCELLRADLTKTFKAGDLRVRT